LGRSQGNTGGTSRTKDSQATDPQREGTGIKQALRLEQERCFVKLTDKEREEELAKLDLLPKRQGQKRADDLLRAMLNSPPDPHAQKTKERAKRAR
jgi:hypothetical protein